MKFHIIIFLNISHKFYFESTRLSLIKKNTINVWSLKIDYSNNKKNIYVISMEVKKRMHTFHIDVKKFFKVE